MDYQISRRVRECYITASMRETYWLLQTLTLDIGTPEYYHAARMRDGWHYSTVTLAHLACKY